jgi:hypothetical protein
MRTDRRLVFGALVLALGGWVCQSNVDDRCPGANTCDIEIANVCCPYGSGGYCDGTCTDDLSKCADTPHVCLDESRVLDCSFEATIESATCEGLFGEAAHWRLRAKGTLTGCGQETVFFKDNASAPASMDCGSWSDGVFGGCIPPSPSTSSTTWTYERDSTAANANVASTTLTLVRAHGNAPALASVNIVCGQ